MEGICLGSHVDCFMEKQEFLKMYAIRDAEFESTGLSWDELALIKKDHLRNTDRLEAAARYVADRLSTVGQLHTVKTRIKDPDHLIEKIIRKKTKHPQVIIDLKNYSRIITDLAGVRALHLFKEDWGTIHEFIIHTWDLQKRPVANICEGDHEEFVERFREKECIIRKHPFGYRSVHYLVSFTPSKIESTTVEIQVRTMLEEAWSEIDHIIRYPYVKGENALAPYLVFLNRLLGNADEIGSFIKVLKDNLPSNGHQPSMVRLQTPMPNQNDTSEFQGLPVELKIENVLEELEERIQSLEKYVTSLKTMHGIERAAAALTPPLREAR